MVIDICVPDKKSSATKKLLSFTLTISKIKYFTKPLSSNMCVKSQHFISVKLILFFPSCKLGCKECETVQHVDYFTLYLQSRYRELYFFQSVWRYFNYFCPMRQLHFLFCEMHKVKIIHYFISKHVYKERRLL